MNPVNSDAHAHTEKGNGEAGRGGAVCPDRGGWGGALTSTATLKSTMDTLVFLCQHTCTMVLPRCGAGLSGELGAAAASSSDSASAVESSGHSGKVSKSLPRAKSLADEEEEERGGAQAQHSVRSLSSQTQHTRFHFFI